jgi:hypothetical protein
MMRSLICAVTAERLFQPAVPAFLQPVERPAFELDHAAVIEVVRPASRTPEAPNAVSMLSVIGAVGVGVAAYAVAKSRAPTVAMGRLYPDGPSDSPSVDALNKPNWNDPREGNPFEESGPRAAVEAYQPRGISDATVPKKQYIETEDEPWNFDARQTVTVTKSMLEDRFQASLPFVKAEEDLVTGLSKAKTKDEVKKLVEAAKDARPGCTALKSAEKLLKAFDEKSEEEALKARPKAPKAAGAQGAGWDTMKRAVAKVHDNSVA